MTPVTKILANTVTIGTANTAISAKLVRILNTGSTVALITVFDTVLGAQIGSIQMLAGSEMYLEKKKTDALTSNNAATVLGVPVAFKN